MNNYVSLVEDQLPAPVKQPIGTGVPEFRPLLSDITLYNDDKGKIMTNVAPSNTIKGQNQGMSFKEWKMKKEQEVLANTTLYTGQVPVSNNILSGVKKHVRFNNLSETQSLPVIQENKVLTPPVTNNSLPPNLIQNPVERRMELSICEAVLKQQQLEEQQRRLQESQRNVRPLFAGLYQQADALHLLQDSRKPIEMAPVASPVQCSCQIHSCVSNNSSPVVMTGTQPILQSPVRVLETTHSCEIRTEALEKRVELLQEQIFLLQQQMSYVLSLQSTPTRVSPVKSSNPFLSIITQEEKKPQMVDSSTQYTIIDPSKKPQSDKTFFNQVLGQVNQILDNTEESTNNNNNHIDSCKFIDSDTSAISIQGCSPMSQKLGLLSEKKPTDKSTVMDSLAAKYLANQTGNTTKTTQDTIDVSTTCYNYLKKYDLLKNYDETEDVIDEKLQKSRRVKLL